jgi:hypothetical protein
VSEGIYISWYTQWDGLRQIYFPDLPDVSLHFGPPFPCPFTENFTIHWSDVSVDSYKVVTFPATSSNVNCTPDKALQYLSLPSVHYRRKHYTTATAAAAAAKHNDWSNTHSQICSSLNYFSQTHSPTVPWKSLHQLYPILTYHNMWIQWLF